MVHQFLLTPPIHCSAEPGKKSDCWFNMMYASTWISGAVKARFVSLNGTSTSYIQGEKSFRKTPEPRKRNVDRKSLVTINFLIWKFIFLAVLFLTGQLLNNSIIHITLCKYASWSKSRIQNHLLSCGDIESNPGPGSYARRRRREGLTQTFKDISFYQQNIQCWKTQKVEICHTLDKLKPDVAIFQETKLNTKTKFIKVEGYRVHRRDRKAENTLRSVVV